jgi:hypothetical protein
MFSTTLAMKTPPCAPKQGEISGDFTEHSAELVDSGVTGCAGSSTATCVISAARLRHFQCVDRCDGAVQRFSRPGPDSIRSADTAEFLAQARDEASSRSELLGAVVSSSSLRMTNSVSCVRRRQLVTGARTDGDHRRARRRPSAAHDAQVVACELRHRPSRCRNR